MKTLRCRVFEIRTWPHPEGRRVEVSCNIAGNLKVLRLIVPAGASLKDLVDEAVAKAYLEVVGEVLPDRAH